MLSKRNVQFDFFANERSNADESLVVLACVCEAVNDLILWHGYIPPA